MRAAAGYLVRLVSLSIGSTRTRMRVSSNTTILPCRKGASIDGKFAKRSANCLSGLRSVPLRKRMTEGFRSVVSASNVPKSVSADTRMRSSSLECAKTLESSADCKPQSRTCDASCPFFRNPSARIGDNALSIKNLTGARAAIHVRAQRQRHSAGLPRCPRPSGLGRR